MRGVDHEHRQFSLPLPGCQLHYRWPGVSRRRRPLSSRVAKDTAKRLLVRIRALREAHGLTQEAFAERAGLTYKHYQQVEAGRKFDIRLSTLVKMADGLGLSLSELVDFNAPPTAAENPANYGAKPVKASPRPRRQGAKST